MNIIQSPKIGLCIAGTKSRQGGFAPLMIAGILAGNEDNNMDRVTLVAEKPVYIIKHTNEYILYLLVDRKVKPCDRDTPGVLSIALTIARDMQLANDKSPYSLLKEVYEKFRNDYMTPCSDGRDSFINKDVEQADFMSIMDQYPLEKRSSVYIPMNPSGISGTLRVLQEQMADLFRDSQYKEFAKYKEIEIGTGANCPMMPNLENIEIPRPVTYSITVNGRTVKATLTKPVDSFDTADVLSDTQDVRYSHVAFRLEELLNSPKHQIESGKSFAVLDKERSCIACEVHKELITYALEYCIEGGTEKERINVANWIAGREMELTIGGKVIRFSLDSPQKTSILASQASLKVGVILNIQTRLGFSVTSTVDDIARSVIVTIRIVVPQRDDRSENFVKNKHTRTAQIYKGKVENDYEKDTEKTIHHDNQLPKKMNKRWIFLAVSSFLSMCVGAGIVSTVWWFVGNRELTYDDSLKIAKSLPIDSMLTDDKITYLKEKFGRVDTVYLQNPDITTGDVITSNEKKGKDEETKKVTEETNQTIAKNKEIDKNRARTEILQLVNEKKLKDCRNHNGWNNALTEDERLAVEAVLLAFPGYKKLSPAAKAKLEKLTTGSFQSLDSVLSARKAILKIISNDK